MDIYWKMKEENFLRRITNLQIYVFFSQFLFSTTVGFFITPLVATAGVMVWISVLLGCALGLYITYISYRLSMRRPNGFLGQYGHEILGKWIHYPLIYIVIFINLFLAAYILRQFTDFIVQIFLPKTPDWAIATLFGVCIAQGVRSGLVTIFRSAQGLFILSIGSVVAFPMFASQQIKFDMAIAFVTNLNMPGAWKGAMIVASLWGEMSFIIYFFPYIKHPKKLMKPLRWAAYTAGVVSLINIFAILFLFGPELTSNMSYPVLELIRYIRVGSFLENLDPLLVLFWLFTMYLKIALFLFVSVSGLTHAIGLKDHKPFTNLMTAAMVFLSINMFRNAAQTEQIMNSSITALLLFTCLIPALYLLVDWIRSSRKKPIKR
jgi:spore germination protein KB